MARPSATPRTPAAPHSLNATPPQTREDQVTVSDPANQVQLESMDFPAPVIEQAIEPKTKSDQEKLGTAIQRLAEEDPTFRVHTDEETGQTIIAGMGELHLEVLIDRMKREFRVEANIGKPQVAYRETLRRAVDRRSDSARCSVMRTSAAASSNPRPCSSSSPASPP